MTSDGDALASRTTADIDIVGDRGLAGHAATVNLLAEQALVPPRSLVARLLGLSPLSRQTHHLYRGVLGEIEVGEALARLGAGWVVLHAVPVEEDVADIGHLVIGPNGVFIVATKNHAGQAVWASQRTFIVGGVRYPYIRDMEYEMGRAERMLTSSAGHAVQVTGVLAIVAPKSVIVRERHRDVAVIASTQLVPWLLRHGRSLTSDEIAAVSRAAALAATWFDSSAESAEPAAIRRQFEALRQTVRGAWRVQTLWATVVSMVTIGGFAVLVYAILTNALAATAL